MNQDRSCGKAEWEFSSGKQRDRLEKAKQVLTNSTRSGYRATKELDYDRLEHGNQLAYEVEMLEEHEDTNVQGVHIYSRDRVRKNEKVNGRLCGEAEINPNETVEAYIIDNASEAVMIGDARLVDLVDRKIGQDLKAE